MNIHVDSRVRSENHPSFAPLAARLFATRQHSLALAAPLSPEDQVVQASADASPTKWHLAHVTWFFETFILAKHLPDYSIFDPAFAFCFNSYYESEGERHPRNDRGLLTRPSHSQVIAYRAHVDAGLERLFAAGLASDSAIAALIETGIQHEQQHQELLLTDILALFAANPLRPAYREQRPTPAPVRIEGFVELPGGIHKTGHLGDSFAWDNESPRHDALVHPFALARSLITNGEWLTFMEAGGYSQPLLWLADGWATVKREGWNAPLYWEKRDGIWQQMTLEGLQPVDRDAPVAHISCFEADAYARYAGARLPTEFEWEAACMAHPDLPGLFGEVWQWTQSAYSPYPGYRPPAGALGEYNGKFMVSQQVLRGSSQATPQGHARPSYRNFFYPHHRWQFMGLRLAKDVTESKGVA